MAELAETLDPISQKGIQEVEKARPIRDERNNITGYVKASIPKAAYEAQAKLSAEDQDPRYRDLKEVSSIPKDQFLDEQQSVFTVNRAVETTENQQIAELRKQLADLTALVSNQSQAVKQVKQSGAGSKVAEPKVPAVTVEPTGIEQTPNA